MQMNSLKLNKSVLVKLVVHVKSPPIIPALWPPTPSAPILSAKSFVTCSQGRGGDGVCAGAVTPTNVHFSLAALWDPPGSAPYQTTGASSRVGGTEKF